MIPENKNNSTFLSRQIKEKEIRKLKAQNKDRSVWSGLGMFGIVGWSIVVPVMLGAALGTWLDKGYPQPFSWTLTFLLIGLIVGCLIAWHWIDNETRGTNLDKEEKDERNSI